MLVSVVVITYNSAQYVVQTLDSILKQTYNDIELIISDDCSVDNTREVCKEWLNKNNYRFQRTILVCTEKNSGICANYNNGLKYCTGQWVKYIAGDDYLTEDCISSFVKATEISNDKIFICGILPFDNNKKQLEPKIRPLRYFAGSSSDQERILVKKGTIIPGPTLFLEIETLKKMGGFEEKYPFIEDYPLCMKYLSNGYKITLVNKYLIHYREYPESVSKSNARFTTSIFDAIDYYAPRAAWRNGMYFWWYHYMVNKYVRANYNKSFIKKVLSYILRTTDCINICNHIKNIYKK